jgi:2-polyprenyl-3-methyl-5-hydroxy-6-metoxy-1,4-benzoquinol methylase
VSKIIDERSLNDYLTGEKFNASAYIKYQFDLKVRNRDTLIEDLVKNKKIIHVGCVDHLDIVESKIAAGTWLHKLLMESATKCIGIDINKEGIDFLKERYKILDLYYGDITKDPIPAIKAEKWDYLLLPEVIEHIPNINEFLLKIKKHYNDNINK